MKKGIYCLESMWNPSVKSKLTVRPILELLEKAEICNHLYHKCATREELEFMLAKWKSVSIQNQFPILYFAYHGVEGGLQLNRKHETISLQELGDLLEDSCHGKVFFFASCETLDIDERKIKSFLVKTGAIAAIGYRMEVDWMKSTAFEILVLNALQEDKFDKIGINKIKKIILNDYGKLHKELDFRMTINDRIPFPRKRKRN
jgi:hypothetical protein